MHILKHYSVHLKLKNAVSIIYHKGENELLSLPHTIQKNQLQMDYIPKCERHNTNASRRICKENNFLGFLSGLAKFSKTKL